MHYHDILADACIKSSVYNSQLNTDPSALKNHIMHTNVQHTDNIRGFFSIHTPSPVPLNSQLPSALKNAHQYDNIRGFFGIHTQRLAQGQRFKLRQSRCKLNRAKARYMNTTHSPYCSLVGCSTLFSPDWTGEVNSSTQMTPRFVFGCMRLSCGCACAPTSATRFPSMQAVT